MHKYQVQHSPQELTHCGLLMPYGIKDLVNIIGSDNSLSDKLLSEQ